MANLNFNANNVEPTTEFEPVPPGKYMAVITGSEMKPTKSGSGSYLELTFEVIEGAIKGRKLWARLNLENSNPLTVKIARSELSALCRAIGVMEPRDSAELHNLPLIITVKQKTRPDTGEITNEIKGFAKKDVAAPAKSQPQQAATTVPPWRRG